MQWSLVILLHDSKKYTSFPMVAGLLIFVGCAEIHPQTTLPDHCVALKKQCDTNDETSCEELATDIVSVSSTCINTSFQSFMNEICTSQDFQSCFDFAGIILSNEFSDDQLHIIDMTLGPHCKRDYKQPICTVLFWNIFIRQEPTDENTRSFTKSIQRSVQYNDIFASTLLLMYSKHTSKKYLDIATANLKVECNKHNSDACFAIGLLYVNKANYECNEYCSKYLLKACNLNHGNACGVLGWLYENGECVIKNPKKAIFFYKKGCELEDENACQNYCEKCNACGRGGT